jgi:hypothetical protein
LASFRIFKSSSCICFEVNRSLIINPWIKRNYWLFTSYLDFRSANWVFRDGSFSFVAGGRLGASSAWDEFDLVTLFPLSILIPNYFNLHFKILRHLDLLNFPLRPKLKRIRDRRSLTPTVLLNFRATAYYRIWPIAALPHLAYCRLAAFGLVKILHVASKGFIILPSMSTILTSKVLLSSQAKLLSNGLVKIFT